MKKNLLIITLIMILTFNINSKAYANNFNNNEPIQLNINLISIESDNFENFSFFPSITKNFENSVDNEKNMELGTIFSTGFLITFFALSITAIIFTPSNFFTIRKELIGAVIGGTFGLISSLAFFTFMLIDFFWGENSEKNKSTGDGGIGITSWITIPIFSMITAVIGWLIQIIFFKK